MPAMNSEARKRKEERDRTTEDYVRQYDAGHALDDSEFYAPGDETDYGFNITHPA